MMGTRRGPTGPFRVAGAMALGVLTGCAGPAAEAPAPAGFEAVDVALWDGRATSGGVWAAHPDVAVPRPATLSRPETGASVDGTLYRRGRELPGPPFALSAAAARALGIEAGVPAEIEALAE